MNQGKLEVVKQEMARVNIDILGISKLKWTGMGEFNSVQFSSVTQSCLTLCDPMNHSTPGLPVHHQLPEFTQTHIHRFGDAIQPSHPLSPLLLLPSVFPNIGVFSNESALRQSIGASASASVLPMNIQS